MFLVLAYFTIVLSHLILLSLQPLHVLKFLSLQGLYEFKQLLCFVSEVHKTYVSKTGLFTWPLQQLEHNSPQFVLVEMVNVEWFASLSQDLFFFSLSVCFLATFLGIGLKDNSMSGSVTVVSYSSADVSV